jgi:hypothetical protein
MTKKANAAREKSPVEQLPKLAKPISALARP